MDKKLSLTEGSVPKSLIRFTVPILFAILLQSMYGAIDVLIVGQFSSVSDISGVTVGSQVMNILTSLCTGLAMGATILLGQKIGENKKEETTYVIGNTIMLFIGIAIVLTIGLLIFNNTVVTLMKTPEEAIKNTSTYLFYCTLGIPLIFAYNVLGSIFRGLGDSKTPLMAVAIACVFNILGDLLFVAVFDMGAGGAAIATVLAQGISVFACIYIISKKDIGFEVTSKSFKFRPDLVKQVLILGSPLALQGILVNFSFLAITVIVNKYGVISSAAVGVSEKIIGFVMLIPMSFMQSMSAYTAQNFGAKKFDRCKKALFTGMAISLFFGLTMAIFTFFKGELLVMLFNNSPEVIASAEEYLKSYAIDTALVPFLFCLVGFFNGCGSTTFVMTQAIVGAIFIRVPMAYLISMSEFDTLFNIGLSTPAATVVQIAMCIGFYFINNKKFVDNKISDSKTIA